MKKENLFAHIDTLDELKPYICPKAVSARDWENVCQECKGKCDAGRRAIQILDEATKPDIPKKAGKGIVTDKMLAGRDAWNELQHEKTLALIHETFAKAAGDNRNPAEVLAEIESIDVTAARKRIDYWVKKYPDLDRELNMKTIMDRYVKRRKRRTHVLSEEASDEISISDILKAADEGRVKTDSVEESGDGVKVAAVPAETLEELEQKVADQLNERKCLSLQDVYDQLGVNQVVPYQEGDHWINPETDIPPFLRTTTDGTAANDNVNRPSHYTFGAIEVIDYIRDKMTPEMFQGFCMGNVLKYVSRHKHKNGVEDLKKANVYLGWLIESEEGAE